MGESGGGGEAGLDGGEIVLVMYLREKNLFS